MFIFNKAAGLCVLHAVTYSCINGGSFQNVSLSMLYFFFILQFLFLFRCFFTHLPCDRYQSVHVS